MRKRFSLEIAPNDQMVVFCPPAVLQDKLIKRIAFGSKSIEVDFFPHPDKHDRIVLSKGIKEALHLPDVKVPLHVFLDNQVLYIGPLIGIFTAGFTPFPLRPIGERTAFFSKLLSVKKTVGAIPFI